MLAIVRTRSAEELAVLVQRQLRFGDVVAAMGVRQEAFAAFADPFDRTTDRFARPR